MIKNLNVKRKSKQEKHLIIKMLKDLSHKLHSKQSIVFPSKSDFSQEDFQRSFNDLQISYEDFQISFEELQISY